jgi:hypothetical protein
MYTPRKILADWSSQERLDDQEMEENRDKYTDLIGILEGKKLLDRQRMDFIKL